MAVAPERPSRLDKGQRGGSTSERRYRRRVVFDVPVLVVNPPWNAVSARTRNERTAWTASTTNSGQLPGTRRLAARAARCAVLVSSESAEADAEYSAGGWMAALWSIADTCLVSRHTGALRTVYLIADLLC